MLSPPRAIKNERKKGAGWGERGRAKKDLKRGKKVNSLQGTKGYAVWAAIRGTRGKGVKRFRRGSLNTRKRKRKLIKRAG